jgi:hypothetical protein
MKSLVKTTLKNLRAIHNFMTNYGVILIDKMKNDILVNSFPDCIDALLSKNRKELLVMLKKQ